MNALDLLPKELFSASVAVVRDFVPLGALHPNGSVPSSLLNPFNRAHVTFRSTGLSPVAYSAVAEAPVKDILDHFKRIKWQASLCTTAWIPILSPASTHAFIDMYSGEAKKANAVRGGYNYSTCEDSNCWGCVSLRERIQKLNDEWEPLPESLDAFIERFGHLSNFQFSPWKFGTYYHGTRHYASPEECFKAVRRSFWLGTK